MSSHRCSSPFCEDPADALDAFCQRHSALIPADELEKVNIAWREMHRRGSGTAEVSRFYQARQRAIDATGPQMIAKAAEDSSGPFRKLFGRSGAEPSSSDNGYKGDIASVSRAQDDSFNRNIEKLAWAAKKRVPSAP